MNITLVIIIIITFVVVVVIIIITIIFFRISSSQPLPYKARGLAFGEIATIRFTFHSTSAKIYLKISK